MESVPPKQYGGTERVVSWLTEELVRLGHDVTLFASGDSVTSAELVSCWPNGLRFDREALCTIPHHLVMLDRVHRRTNEFDVIHFHIDYLHFPLFRDRAAQYRDDDARAIGPAFSGPGVLALRGNAAGLDL